MNDERFDDLLDDMRSESASAEEINEARERVWERLAASMSPACEDVRPDLLAYAGGHLNHGRRLLIDDHLSRCVDCRHALADIKGERKVVEFPHPVATRRPWMRWAVAASLVLAVVYLGRGAIDAALAPSGPRATVVSVTGTMVHWDSGAAGVGYELADSQSLRTAAASRAVLRLDDGSLVEMNERTELSVAGAWSGNTIRLERGDIVVEAADQGAGRLRVVTRDSVASVKGTVFAVSSATAGSLVSIIEGSVEVAQPGFEELLGAGQQAATAAALGGVSVRQAISWSSGAEGYYALLADFARLEERIASTSSLRTQANLLPWLPADAIAYVAIPNLAGTLSEAMALVDQHALGNESLAALWSSPQAQSMREALEHVESMTPLLGDEIVLVLTGDALAGDVVPLMMAQVQTGREDALRAAIRALADNEADLPFLVGNGLLLVADSAANLTRLSGQLGGGAQSGFAVEIGRRYGRGVGWLAALDVRALGTVELEDGLGPALGAGNMSYLFIEQHSDALGDDTQATLMFDGPRTGIASWIGQPGPIGSADYVSADAIAVSSGSTGSPREAFDQVMSLLETDSELFAELRQLELEAGISVGDIAASLGTDFVIALEQIALPMPGWIAAVEVINPGALDNAIRRVITRINDAAAASGEDSRLMFGTETINGRVWKSLRAGSDPLTLYWTYDRGYLVASTDQGLAARAISVRDSGGSLVRSSTFQRQFPRDGGVHNSGFFWLNTASVADELAALAVFVDLQPLALSREPVLIVLTGESDQVRWSSRTRFTSVLLELMLGQPAGEIGS